MEDMSNITGGTIANSNGNVLEKFLADRLVDEGYTQVINTKFIPATYLEQPVFARKVYIGKSIYGTNMYCDFLIYHPQKHKDILAVECKWQQSAGSVDEKYPYLVTNIQHIYPYKTIIIVDGGGYKPKALEWLKSQVGNNLKGVYSLMEITTMANKKFF